MYPDVIDLNDFYESRLGRVARQHIGREIGEIWPNVKGLRVLGIGYPTPYLGGFRGQAERAIAVMPAAQGVIRWPSEGPALAALADEHELPLPDQSVDRVILVHALENTDHAGALLREVWRVMTAEGRLLLVVPNRRGLWARFERTPFGQGRPFSGRQINMVLQDSMFSPLRKSAALFMPPSERKFILRFAGSLERAGGRWWRNFGGVRLIEASKQIYGLSAAAPARRFRRRAPVPSAGTNRARLARTGMGGSNTLDP
ncbi:MAG: methyltransferase domain-containing protein [Rhodospirillales bacterium]|nr:methyltransferase domain-containing protein [Rhodospirillales bacterium]